MSLFANEMIVDDSNYKLVCGDGEKVIHNGQEFFLAARPPAAGERLCAATPFEQSGLKIYGRDELEEKLKEQVALKARNSDYQKYEPKNQQQTNYCWMNGPCGAVATARVRQGLPYAELSAASAAGPFTHYHNVGGNEYPAIQWLMEHGATSTDLWPNAAIDKRLDTSEVSGTRPFYMPVDVIELTGSKSQMLMQLLSGLADGYQGALAYYWMSHVMETADPVLIEKGSFGVRTRNSWGQWGAQNEAGFYGYATYREGKGSPDSGFLLKQAKAAYIPGKLAA